MLGTVPRPGDTQAGGRAFQLQEHRAERQVPGEVPESHLPDPYHPHPCVTRSRQVSSLPISRLHPQLCKPAATTLGHHVSAVSPTGHLSFHPAPSLVCVLCTTNEVLEYQAHNEWTCLISCHLLLPLCTAGGSSAKKCLVCTHTGQSTSPCLCLAQTTS